MDGIAGLGRSGRYAPVGECDLHLSSPNSNPSVRLVDSSARKVNPSRRLLFRIDASVSMPICKCALRALHALGNSNRSAPHSVSRAQKPCLQSSLSLLLSNLSSTNSKGSGPTRTSPEKGYSRTPIVKSTWEMIKANTATISLCTSVFSKPNR